ncbi:GNAT family N-acetyltransferase [Crocinitomix algicola]|uniref:GNAT family N-acetyltransferase n=1 Tax=Crocinitomix algicola TaxID=1740263 RepID=UPI000872C026|nr:GNAT family N-acetyltransferase [Crocinitomix algicola]
MKFTLFDFETERLFFRALKWTDFEDWIAVFENDQAVKFLALDPMLSPKELCQIWFDKAMYRYENNLGGMNVLCSKIDEQIIGQAGILIQDLNGEEIIEIGYTILPQYWRKGYASEAAIGCKKEGFKRGYAKEFHSIIHPENIGSKAVALNNGMTFKKRVPEYRGIAVDVYHTHTNQ